MQASTASIICVVVAISIAGLSKASFVTNDNIDGKLRLLSPILMMLEDLVKLENTNNCFEKMFCLLETTEKSIEEDNPLKHFSRILTNTHNDFDHFAAEKFADLVKKFPQASKVVDAILTGQIANDSRSCHLTYAACKVEEEQIISGVSGLVSEFQNLGAHLNLKRDDCDAVGLTCGVVGAGCALCTAATEGLCGVACIPEVGAACSGYGIGCAIRNLFG